MNGYCGYQPAYSSSSSLDDPTMDMLLQVLSTAVKEAQRERRDAVEAANEAAKALKAGMDTFYDDAKGAP